MAANLQSRSASISTPVDGTPSMKPTGVSSAIGATTTSLRSASIGSSFFHKDTSNFFNPNDAANTSSSSMDDDIVREADASVPTANASSDLDIVGALGNLDLDDDFELPKGNKAANKSDTIIAEPETKPEPTSTPFQQHMLYGENYQQFYPYIPQHQGSLTPNPSIGAFGPSAFRHVNTPSNTWSNNFIPSSAPPFAYGNNSISNDLTLSIKPFELTDENKAKENGDGMPNLHLPFSTPPPPLTFGGILDSQAQFGIPSYGVPDGHNKAEGSSSESEVESSTHTNTNTPGQQTFSSRSFSINGTPSSAIEFQPLGVPDPKANMGAVPGQDLMKGKLLNDNLSMPLPNMIPPQLGPTMWNQHPILSPQIHPNMRNSLMDNRTQPQQNQFNIQGSNRYNNSNNNSNNNNRHRNYGNDAMNIHRKMHNNNRRKGDDASKYANAKLEDFTGEIYSLCKDQHGCRFLQRQLDLGREVAEGKNDANVLTNDIAATMIFNEIYLKIIELMTDPFGNYLIQKLFENVSTDQRVILVKNAAPEFIRIALDPHGTRALQKLVECISTEEESKLIIEALSPHIVSLSRDLNGNHVVQKCLQKLKPEEHQFIFETASLHCNEIATHRHGCCVLQRCLDHGNAEQRKQLSLKVAENATNLSLDPFGNYVVQYVLSRGDVESIRIILDHIKSNVISLSLHKFGSNVIEKSLRINKLTDSLIEVLLLNKDRFSDMLNDAFGNYVLQTSLDVANHNDLMKLSQALQPLLANIKNTPHGRRIMTKIQCIL